MGTPNLAALATTEKGAQPGRHLEQMFAERFVQLGRRHRAVELARDEKFADELVGVEQHLRGEQDVVDADDAFFVEHAVVEEGRAAAQRVVQRVVQVVVEIGAGADDEVDEAAFHQRDDAAAEAGGRERAGDGEADGGVVRLRQHLVAEDAARLAEAGGVEGLEAFVDQRAHGGAAARLVVANRFAGEKRGLLAWTTGRTIGH